MKLLFTLLLFGSLLYPFEQKKRENMNVVRFELEGRQYDDLHLRLTLGRDMQLKSVKGYSEDGYNWFFFFPDSLYDYIRTSIIYVPNTPDSVSHRLGFHLVLPNDTAKVVGYRFGRPVSFVRARYLETEVFTMLMRKPGTDEAILGTFIVDSYEVFTEDQELISSIKGLYSGLFTFQGPYTYEETVQRQMELIRQYPNSRFIIGSLYGSMGVYRSKADIAQLFNLFTEELQQSFFGQKIYRHITRDMTFINQKLATWDTDVFELIIQDSSKFNLVLFSASWCAPCTRQIPIVKEIYRDLGQKLIVTYVSLDHERTVENWRTKMREHEIPWRSLMVLTQEKDRAIRDDYAVFGVPTAILVHPNSMKKEVLNLWEEEHRQRLYELVAKQ